MAKKIKIIIVEDDPDIQFMYQEILSDNFSIKIIDNPEKAYNILDKEFYDLMILDIILPKETGDSFLVNLRQDNKLENLKVIVVSVLGDIGEKLKDIDNRIEYLHKPFDKESLIKLINKMTRK